MKKVLTKFVAFSSIALLMLSACKKNDMLVTSDGGKAGTLNANITTLVLDKTKLTDTNSVINLSFTAPKYNFAAAVTNTLQIDSAGDNWAKPVSVTMGTNVLSQTYNTNDFNTLLLKLIPAGKASKVNVRVQHSLSTSVITYSNVITLTLTPFNLTSWIYVPGGYEGWANPGASEDSLTSVTGNGIYTGIINFTGSDLGFKIVPVKGSWDGGLGDAGGGKISTSGGNINAPAVGQTLVTVNLNNNTITMVPANHYSIIGSVTSGGDFTTDVNMKYINDGNQGWSVITPLTSGQLKFRQNNDWAYSWGDVSPADGVNLTDSNGANINLATGGNYKVELFIPLTPVSTNPPPVTATYKITKQ